MEAFEQQECQAAILRENSMLMLHCCDPHYDLCFTVPSLPFLKLHGTCCHFSFMNNPSERRSCVIPNSEALLSKLDGVKSPCIINVKTSAVFKVCILKCITVIGVRGGKNWGGRKKFVRLFGLCPTTCDKFFSEQINFGDPPRHQKNFGQCTILGV
jgi:hypothetical protein